jgi:hypothetical protein
MDRPINRRRTDYKLRKLIDGPVFCITNHVMNFRQIFMRVLKLVSGEWNLAHLGCNMKPNHNFCCSPLQF